MSLEVVDTSRQMMSLYGTGQQDKSSQCMRQGGQSSKTVSKRSGGGEESGVDVARTVR